MLIELLNRCLLGDKIAQFQLYHRYYLTIQLEALCRELLAEQKLILITRPHPESPLETGKQIFERDCLAALAEVEPVLDSWIDADIRINALQQIQKAFSSFLQRTEKRITIIYKSKQ